MNKRQQAFVYFRARGYNLIDSIYKAGYKPRSRMIASVYGSKLEAKGNIKEAVEQERVNIFDKATITDEYVLDLINNIAKNGKSEANRLKASELLARYRSMLTDRQEIRQDLTVSDTDKALIDRLFASQDRTVGSGN